jgi:hypothetical protein
MPWDTVLNEDNILCKLGQRGVTNSHHLPCPAPSGAFSLQGTLGTPPGGFFSDASRKYSRAQLFFFTEVLPALSGEEFPRPRPNLPLKLPQPRAGFSFAAETTETLWRRLERRFNIGEPRALTRVHYFRRSFGQVKGR